MTLEPGQAREIIFLLGYSENEVSQKFDPPESTIINKALVREVIKKYLDQNAVNEAYAEPETILAGTYWKIPSGNARRACESNGEHMECLPMCHHVQSVAVCFVF